MKKSKRSLRYIRYRAISWLKGIFTFPNFLLTVFVIVLVFVVLAVQKFEEPYSINLFASGPFLPVHKRLELVVTTARIPPKPTSKNCEENQVEITTGKKESSYSHRESKIDSQKIKTEKKSIRYLPAIRTFYPFNQKNDISKKLRPTTSSKSNKNADGPQSDVYRTEPKSINSAERDGDKKPIAIEPDKWLRVNKEKNKVLVFSAYWDERDGNPTVRIMAIMTTKLSPQIYCRFLMADNKFVDVTATKKTMNEHWRLKYASFFLSCQLPNKSKIPPAQVVVSTDPDYVDSVTLPIHHNKNDTLSPRGHIAVCVKPFHYNYDRATWLLEFLELHRMLGVDHFFFYNHTVGSNVEKVLRSYMDMDLVTVLPWEIGIKSQKEIRTEGIFSSLNDCLFRTMFLFQYAIMLDFDEYIIPRDHDTYSDMLEKIEKDNRKIRGRPGSFVFRNVFFYLYWENDTTVFGVPPERPPNYMPYLLTQYKTRRMTSSMKPGSRSKYIVIPERAVEVGNHVVWKHTPGSRPILVPDRTALLHHYRICEFGGYSCLKKTSAKDPTAQRFGPELLDRVRYQCELAFKPTGKCPISPPLGSPW